MDLFFRREREERRYIEDGTPRENGYPEPFNGKLRRERPAAEALDALLDAKVLTEGWGLGYNQFKASEPGTVRANPY